MKYDRAHTEAFYDAYGEREWERFERNAAGRVNFETHLHFLKKYIQNGDHVLEIGAGPGRFTIELAKLGTKIFVADLSGVQLELNKQKLSEAGYESHIHGRVQCDIIDLSMFNNGAFDAVVAFGGPVSYALDKADNAIAETLRVTKKGGYVLFSVMSRLGSLKNLFPPILELADNIGFEAISYPWRTGLIDEHLSSTGHRFRLFLASELQEILRSHSCQALEFSASNYLSSESDPALDDRWSDSKFWDAFLEIELEACCQPGALDGGTHIIAILEKE